MRQVLGLGFWSRRSMGFLSPCPGHIVYQRTVLYNSNETPSPTVFYSLFEAMGPAWTGGVEGDVPLS